MVNLNHLEHPVSLILIAADLVSILALVFLATLGIKVIPLRHAHAPVSEEAGHEVLDAMALSAPEPDDENGEEEHTDGSGAGDDTDRRGENPGAPTGAREPIPAT